MSAAEEYLKKKRIVVVKDLNTLSSIDSMPSHLLAGKTIVQEDDALAAVRLAEIETKKEIYKLAIKSHNNSVCKFLRGLGDFKDIDIKEE